MPSRFVKLSVTALISAAIGLSPIAVIAADPLPASAPVSQAEKSADTKSKKKAKKNKKAEKKAKKKSQKKAKAVQETASKEPATQQ
ncbi:protein tyrosine phosphatase [Polynucleobacter arcticus]|uniref:Protein tyrosine phosphatase n=1 Tax=Polynucleobacter arcticus TaxID=1743165 RepID=A0A6M9PS99_9BURK|nr:protein tyrosine phosphatase [Polynucleobacter arcticus]QKM60786.1 protein tyrosine phosphatase [Polynucleobacter arcticus]